MSGGTDRFQVSIEVAETYEASYVPSLFAHLAPHLVDAAGVGPGQRVLDVACGTGIVARTAAGRVGAGGSVVGVDLNEAMLGVARRVRPDLEWYQGDAATLPFPDEAFDVALCQSALMYMPDTTTVLREMARVVTADGTVAVQLWSDLERQKGVRRLVETVARYAGPDAVNLMSTYFRLGDPEAFTQRCRDAGLPNTRVHILPFTLHAGSIDDYVTSEVESSPLIEQISNDTYRRIREDARIALAPFCGASGELELPMEVYLVTARKR